MANLASVWGAPAYAIFFYKPLLLILVRFSVAVGNTVGENESRSRELVSIGSGLLNHCHTGFLGLTTS